MKDIAKELAKLAEELGEIELHDVDLFAEELELRVLPQIVATAAQSGLQALGAATGAAVPGPAEWRSTTLKLPDLEFPGTIETVEFKRSNGTTVTIGGEVVPPFWNFLTKKNPHRPVVTLDVFDMNIGFPKPIKEHYQDVFDDQVAWAKRAQDKYGADMVTLHLLSSDPGWKDTSPKDCAKLLEEVAQAVHIPFIIGGSGNKEKDPLVFKACAAAVEAERSMLSSADEPTWDKVVPIAIEHDHNVLLWSQLDLNQQKTLNRNALQAGVPRDHVVMDPTTATLGYGLEYSFSIYQRNRLAGLLGDAELAFPMSGGTTNAWGAREAYKSEAEYPEWGPRSLRGPLWEIYTALSLSLCGLDLAMMFHPIAAITFKQICVDFQKEATKQIPDIQEWVTVKN
ncbi:MAG: CO dehydrogenase/acetyl-CoA synthase subunit delta [Promethearchaeota archaeon]